MNETVELESSNKTTPNPIINNPIYSPDEVITDYLHFFSGGRNDNMFKYAYLPDNNYYDRVISECGGYYLCRDEVDTIKNNLHKFTQHIGSEVDIFEIGPGSERAFLSKMLPILNSIKNPLSYHAIDISAEFAQHAIDLAVHHYPMFKTGIIVKNFADLSPEDFPLSINQKALFCLGSTLGNFNDQFINIFIGFIASVLTKDDKFVFTADFNHDAISLIKAYDDKDNHNFCKNILRYANEKFSNIDWENGFKFTAVWKADTTSVEFLFCAEFDQIINIQGYEVFIKKGSLLYGGKARKFSDAEVSGMLLKNNLVVVDRLNCGGHMNTYICTKI